MLKQLRGRRHQTAAPTATPAPTAAPAPTAVVERVRVGAQEEGQGQGSAQIEGVWGFVELPQVGNTARRTQDR